MHNHHLFFSSILQHDYLAYYKQRYSDGCQVFGFHHPELSTKAHSAFIGQQKSGLRFFELLLVYLLLALVTHLSY